MVADMKFAYCSEQDEEQHYQHDLTIVHEKAFDGWIPSSIAYYYLVICRIDLKLATISFMFWIVFFPLVT
jgi:hypothetical protein